MIRSLLHPGRSIAATVAALGAATLLAGCGSAVPSIAGSAAAAAFTRTVTATVTAGTAVSQAPTTIVKTVTVTATPSTVEQVPSTSAEDTSPSTPTGLKVGGVGIKVSDSNGGADVAVLTAQRKTAGTGDYSDPPKNGNYVVVDISYTCTSGKFTYNPFDWTMRDAQGRSYDGGFSMSGYGDPALNSGNLAKGSKARGFVVFDAPKGALTLEYSAGYDSAPASWAIPA